MSAHHPTPPTAASAPPLLWDVFCRVVDNYGDIGVCWRLAADLAGRGQRVRLWADDVAALRWMAPEGHPGVEVATWQGSTAFPPPGDVVVEAFGCDPPPAFVAAMAARAADNGGAPGRAPVWINLEYLSAEPYVERSHGLASPQANGLTKWFFYPGYTAATGGLLREPGLVDGQRTSDRAAWLAAHGIALRADERLVSLFCYPGAPAERLVASLVADGRPALLATTPGAATGAVRAAITALGGGANTNTGAGADTTDTGPAIRQHALPWLTQADFDRLLQAADLNFVRGEDSWVRAQWAGKPFVWQAYRQDDGAHAAKVGAFLDQALHEAEPEAADALRRWHAAWNGLDDGSPLPGWTSAALATAGRAALAWRARLLDRGDLVTSLLAFVREKR